MEKAEAMSKSIEPVVVRAAHGTAF